MFEDGPLRIGRRDARSRRRHRDDLQADDRPQSAGTIGDRSRDVSIHTGLSKAEINTKVLALLADVRIRSQGLAKTHELSGASGSAP
jgi:hypothetical protein